MIVVTGAAGFIGSNLMLKLNKQGFINLVAVDRFDNPLKSKNLDEVKLIEQIDRDQFFSWIQHHHQKVENIVHLGARTDTTEMDFPLLEQLNTHYTKGLWKLCSKYQIPLIYASSAATYGNGAQGFSDDEQKLPCLEPLNPYARSKHLFDLWAVEQVENPPFWAGLKFFNVYGPNEAHKGRMASIVHHAKNKIKEHGKMRLFRSHNPDFKDGEQKRDFIHVNRVTEIIYQLLIRQKDSGIYNVGTGKARTFLEMIKPIFLELDVPENIEFIDIPLDIRANYQYFTEAEMGKLERVLHSAN